MRNADGRITLVLRDDASKKEVVADKVVFALPFSILRESVDLSRSGFSVLKLTAIDQLGIGTNSKLHLQFADRSWNKLGCNGESFADTGYQNVWDVTRAQSKVGTGTLTLSGNNAYASGTTISAECSELIMRAALARAKAH